MQPFSGLVGKADPPPINFTCPLNHMDSDLFFYFYKVRSLTPWLFAFSGFSYISDLGSFWVGALFVLSLSCGYPRCYLGAYLWLSCISDIFGGGTKLFWGTLYLFLCDLLLRTCPNFLVGLPLVAGFASSFQPLLAGGVLVGSFCYCSSLPIKRAENLFWGTASRFRVMSLGVASIPPGLIFPWHRMSRGAIFTPLRWSFFLLPSFLLFCRGG